MLRDQVLQWEGREQNSVLVMPPAPEHLEHTSSLVEQEPVVSGLQGGPAGLVAALALQGRAKAGDAAWSLWMAC